VTPSDVGIIKDFVESHGFDRAYHPGIKAADANRNNILRRPYLYEAAIALLGSGRATFMRDYKFHVEPASDDRPYFFRFFKWRMLPELITLGRAGGAQLVEWGYLILIATLVQAVIASLIVILLPLWTLRRGERAKVDGERPARLVVYFFALGLAFLFIEIAFIQRFTLFLSHPLYAVAVVLCAFLVFAGFGSGFADRLDHRWPRLVGSVTLSSPIAVAVAGIVVTAGVYLLLLPVLFEWALPLPQPAKVVISIVLIAPLAFCMGMPFPLGLKRVSDRAPRWVPWAWGINGCASVLSAILATLLAIHFGFTLVVALAMALYVIAAAAFATRDGRSEVRCDAMKSRP
jgi:hypothetical protein